MNRTIEGSKKDARNFRASFSFVLFLSKRGKCKADFSLLGKHKTFNPAKKLLFTFLGVTTLRYAVFMLFYLF